MNLPPPPFDVLPAVEHVCVMPVRTLNGVEVPPDLGDAFRCSCNQQWVAHDGVWRRRCPNPRCDHGMVGGKTGFSYDYPWPCDDCDGKGWIG